MALKYRIARTSAKRKNRDYGGNGGGRGYRGMSCGPEIEVRGRGGGDIAHYQLTQE